MHRRLMAALVLVHGGAHAGDCWELTVQRLRQRAPELPVLAVDLPGHGDEPGELESAKLADWVTSTVAQIDRAGLDEVVLVGHSLAGLTVPGVAIAMGPVRVRGMVFVACSVPEQGAAMVDTLRGPLRRYGIHVARRGTILMPPRWLARYLFCNGMTAEQRAFTLARSHPECASIFLASADRRGLSDEIPRSWILTTRDRAMTPRSQRTSIAALGAVQTVIEVDSGHNVMISKPEWLADRLLELCRRWAP